MEKMKLIQRLIEREWTLFDKVHNIGGRPARMIGKPSSS